MLRKEFRLLNSKEIERIKEILSELYFEYSFDKICKVVFVDNWSTPTDMVGKKYFIFDIRHSNEEWNYKSIRKIEEERILKELHQMCDELVKKNNVDGYMLCDTCAEYNIIEIIHI